MLDAKVVEKELLDLKSVVFDQLPKRAVRIVRNVVGVNRLILAPASAKGINGKAKRAICVDGRDHEFCSGAHEPLDPL